MRILSTVARRTAAAMARSAPNSTAPMDRAAAAAAAAAQRPRLRGNGGDGGNYGGGGGGGGYPQSGTTWGMGGNGGNGIIVITYTPAISATILAESRMQWSIKRSAA